MSLWIPLTSSDLFTPKPNSLSGGSPAATANGSPRWSRRSVRKPRLTIDQSEGAIGTNMQSHFHRSASFSALNVQSKANHSFRAPPLAHREIGGFPKATREPFLGHLDIYLCRPQALWRLKPNEVPGKGRATRLLARGSFGNSMIVIYMSVGWVGLDWGWVGLVQNLRKAETEQFAQAPHLPLVGWGGGGEGDIFAKHHLPLSSFEQQLFYD